ncbi:MAG: hypothetical protein ACYS8X_12095 [Planctomycetota bacterium]
MTTVTFGLLRDVGSFELAEEPFKIVRGSWRGDFVLTGTDGEVYRASTRERIFSCRFKVDIDGREFALTRKSCFSWRFMLQEDGVTVGEIRLAWFSSKATIDLPEALPYTVQVFLYWLAALVRLRAG